MNQVSRDGSSQVLYGSAVDQLNDVCGRFSWLNLAERQGRSGNWFIRNAPTGRRNKPERTGTLQQTANRFTWTVFETVHLIAFPKGS